MLLFFLRARLPRKRQLATSVANVRRSSMSARPRRHLRLSLPKHLAPFSAKTLSDKLCCFFLRARLLRRQQLATFVANVRRSSMSARPRRHLRLPLPKHLAPSRIKTFFNRSVLLFFLRARLLRKRQLATSVVNVRRSSMSASPAASSAVLAETSRTFPDKNFFQQKSVALFFCVRGCCASDNLQLRLQM